MDQVTVIKRNFQASQWKQRIADCQASGMTINAWCKQNKVSTATYYRYLKQFRNEICEALPIPVPEPEKPMTFQKLEVQSPLPDTQAAVILHLSNASLEINNGATQQTVEAVLLALKNIC